MTQNNSQFDLYDTEFDDSYDVLSKRVKRNNYTAPKELIQETSMSGGLTDPFEKPDLPSSQKKSTYQPKKKVRVLSPPRQDSFQESDATPKQGMRTYAEILLARKLENEQVDLQAKVARVQREQAQIAKSYTKQEKTVPQVPLASTAESSISEWEKDEPSLKAQKGNYAKSEAKASRWDQVEDTPSRFSSRGFAFTETPTPRRLGKSRWDETPNFGGYQTPNRLGGETPTMTGKRGWETPTAGQFREMEALTPGRIQQLVMERQVDERNRPWRQEELDQLLPSAGFEVVKAPQDYQPPRTFDSNLTPSSYYQIPASTGRPYEVPCTPSQGNEAIPNINPEDLGYFGALLNPVNEENLTIEEQKERKVMTLLLKIKNGTPPMRKSALRQITENARELGAEHLFNQILPLLMSPTLQDKERHLFVKVIDRVLYKLDDLVRPYVHKILNVIEPLLIDQDYYARIEAREIISNLAKSAGLASMISAMRPDIDHHDEYVRNTTARAFAVVASALGIPTLLPFLKAVCQSKKSWQARHTGIRIVQQIAILMGCSVLPHLSSLVNIIASGLDKNENQKIRILTALTVAALAEAASPYGIEAFEEIIEPLWKDAERTSPKNLAAILKAMGYIILLMENEDAGEYVDKICPLVVKQFDSADEEMKVIILKVLKQCVSTEGVKSSYIRENILSPFLKNFWMRKSALNNRSYKHVVETTVEIAKKVGGAEIIQEIVGYLKDSNELFRKMTLETIQNIIVSLGAADITYHAEKRLMDGLLCAFHEQTFGDNSPVMLNGFAAIVNVLNQRAKPYFPQICGIIQWRLNNKSARVRQQAADLVSRIALAMKNCGEETKLGKLGVMLYESLGEEYPEVLGSILGGLKAIVNVIGMNNMTPPIKDLLPRLTPILKNRHEKVQENCIDLVGRIADRGAEYVSAKEWMRICFDLLDLLNAHKKGIRRAAINTFGYIASAIGPQDVLCTLLNNLKVQERQNRVCTAIAIAVVSEACGPFTTIPAMMNEYRVPEQNVQNGILKSLSFIFEYVGEMAKDYIYTLLPLLEDALTDRDIVHRQTAACVVKHISVSVAGLGCEDALVHLLNYVWPNIFEENPHLRNAVMGAVEAIKLGVGPGNVLLYVLQGLYHPARRIRDTYWTFYNMLYQSSQDSLNAFLPNLNNDAENCYTRHELFYVM